MKGFDEKGIVWFTNYKSRKGKDLDLNPVAAATFWWAELERSVRIEGRVEKTSDQESDAYFNSRPRGSQIGAWSSNQSHEIGSRAELDEQERLVKERFSDESKPVPRPPHWGGFRLVPNRIEFWKGRSSRMHDRIVYERDTAEVADKSWRMVRLQP
jgi:pyridoxamine 5'-phosphate oxidase